MTLSFMSRHKLRLANHLYTLNRGQFRIYSTCPGIIKKGSKQQRVIMDLSWPVGASVNEGVDGDYNMGDNTPIRLPTVQLIDDRLLELGREAYMYKTDLARGYRQLRVDPPDRPLLGLQHRGKFYLDICPPFGLKTSALFIYIMQSASEAVCYIHGLHVNILLPHIWTILAAPRGRYPGRTVPWTLYSGSWPSWASLRRSTRYVALPRQWSGSGLVRFGGDVYAHPRR